MQNQNPETVTLKDILITEELSQRAPRAPNWQAEVWGMQTLTQQMVNSPELVLQRLVELALNLCQAGTTGISLLETTPDGDQIFRWEVLAGTLAHHVGGTTPRDFSSCGVCLDRGAPVLFAHPDRYFTYFQAANTPIVEELVLPLTAAGCNLGTLWIMSHDEQRHFDSEDVRIVTSLADLAAAALLLEQRQTQKLTAKNVQLASEVSKRQAVINQYQQTEIALRESEGRLRALIQNLPGGAVFVVDRDLRYLLAEGEAFAAAGFKPEDFVGQTIFEALPPELAANYELMYRKALAGEPFEDEHQAHDHWYISRGTPLRTGNGEIYAGLVVSYDISERKRVEDERKQAEEALRESEAKYRTLFNSIDAGFCVIEVLFDEHGKATDYRFLEANPAFEQQTGLVDAIDKTMRELAPQHEAHWFEIYGRIALTGIPERFENVAKELGRFYDVYAFRTGEPQERKVAILFNDISERKQAEQELTKTNQLLQATFDNSLQIIQLFKAVRDERGEIADFEWLLTNKQWNDQWGEMAGKRLLKENPAVIETGLFDMFKQVTESGVPITHEHYYAYEQFDGWFLQTIAQVEDGFLLTTLDITDRKQAEEQLRRAAEMDAFRVKLSDAIRPLTDPDEIIATVSETVGRYYNVGRCGYAEVPPPYDHLVVARDWTNGIMQSLQGALPLASFGDEMIRQYRTGQTVVVEDAFEDARNQGKEAGLKAAGNIRSSISVQLVKQGNWVASFYVQDTVKRSWTQNEVDLMEEIADRTWAAVERARAEEALGKSEAKYRSLFTSIDEGFNLLEMIPGESDHPADFRIVETNPAWEQQIGLTDAAGKTLLEVAPDFEQQWLDFYSDVVMSGRGRRSEYYTASVDRWYTVFASRIGGEGSRQVAVVFNDITDRKRTEEQQAFLLKFSDALRGEPDADSIANRAVRMLAEHLHLDRVWLSEVFEQQGISTVGPEYHHPDLPPMSGVYRLSDYPKTMRQLLTQPMVIHDVASDPNFSDSEKALLNQLHLRALLVVSLRKGQNQVIWALAATVTTPRHWNESERVLLEQVSERTWSAIERSRAEAALRESELQRVREQSEREQERQRAESLAELDRAKTSFFSNISHEFRTPLTLSLAPLQDALSDRTHPLDPVHRERLELVNRNSLRLLKLINTLLDFSRIEAGRMEAIYEPTDLATYTAELASVFRSAIERAGLQLIVDCPPLPEPVFVDREMWEKIVLNLLSNAFKFTFEGEIRVSLYSTDRNQAILQVQDTGSGIAPEHLPHLFERFYQVRGTQARTQEGSGIGLALVHELVRLQGGTIEVSSTVGEGTCFTIALTFGTDHLPSDRLHFEGDRYPVRTLASTAMGATAYVEEAERWLPEGNGEASIPALYSLLPTPPSARVLVVDDNADMREYLTRILSEHVQVEAVADGVTALAAAQARVPDLILSDVMMPGLDGFELLEALRADPRTKEIPIILLSARAGEEAIVEGLEAGADGYLVKPFSAQELVSRVTAHLQMAQLRGEALQQERIMNRQKDEFISTVSHELNTPLVSILGWTRLLRSNPPSPAMLNKALDTIERNATLQAKLVQDLLDLSRITVGKLRLNPQLIELKPVIETAIATVAQAATDKGINLTWQEIISEPVVVMGDSDRLSQVLINLLSNAIKFTPESGSVTLELSVVNNDGSADASYAEIRVTDTGIGIAADFLPHVFDRFRQAEGVHSAKGLGLGLAIARHIVELHNGTIHAESAGEGQGATFIVRLPLLQDDES